MCIPGAADGGSVTAKALFEALRNLGVRASLCSSDYGNHIGNSGDPDIHIFPQTFAKPMDLSLGVQHFLWQQVRRAGICHFFAFYATATLWGARLAHRNGVPYVISPMGNTIPETGQHQKAKLGDTKKRLYFELLAKPVLRNAAFIICATEIERDRISRYVPEGRFVVVSHGREELAECLEEPVPELPPNARFAFFLGRLSPEKSLPFLLEVWANVRRRNPKALLVIAGDDRLCPGYERVLRARASELGLDEVVHFTGTVNRGQKKWLFARCTCLVLPSTNENFGHVVVEALAAGRPAITSTGTPWQKMAEGGVGRWLRLERDAWVDCLSEYLSDCNRPAHPEVASRCREWVSKNIPTWNEAAEAHLRVYEEAMRIGNHS